jgi:RNA polymerase sigma-70 factor (ECF subfamily)
MDQATRPSLLERLRDVENHAAWAEFFALYGGMIRGYARKLGCSAAAADDVTQETLVRLLKRMPEFVYASGNGHPFRSYLLEIAHGRVVDSFRREGRFTTLPETPSGEIPVYARAGNSGAALTEAPDAGDLAWAESVLAEAWRRVRGRIRPETARAFRALATGTAPAALARDLGIARNTLDQCKFQVVARLRREVKGILAEAGEVDLPPSLLAAVGQAPWDEAARDGLRQTFETGTPPAGQSAHMRYVQGLLESGARPALPGVYLGDATPPAKITWTVLASGLIAGAAPNTGLRLPHRGVSGQHTRFDRTEDGCWHVVDLGSTSGTAVDGRLVPSARLLDGSIVQMGEAVLVFVNWE